MFENYRTFKTTYAGRELVVETGKTCGLANGSCWVRYGDTVVMGNVTASAKPREGVDFFPLSVDFEEKLYAVGKIPGSFLKREGKASEKAILTSRCVDRPIRPLFPKGNTRSQVEDSTSHTITYEERPLFELVNMIMMHTMLPRLAIVRIIKRLSDNARNKINNQDYLEEAISIINKQLAIYKSKNFSKAELVASVGTAEKDIFEVDKIANEEEIRYLFTPNPLHRRAMNLKYKFDSEGELKFAKALDDDPNVLLYTKLKKGGFVIETPVGNYSPDWAIVYQKDNDQLAMYFIAETKWDKETGDLSDDEIIKISCATMHFKAVDESMTDIVKYKWVNAYKDSTKDHSFPQIFIDNNYSDSLAIERLSNQ